MKTGVTGAILRALDHVREYHPEVVMVVFSKQGEWRYLTEGFEAPEFEAPEFEEGMDKQLIWEAADSVPHLPYIYQL